ncbi:MAG: AMP-binding protein [Micropruina sp.]|uniref:AMP-binding protein n=1 Tax=Micropruina sp. TaxID=2737536 RepID=UPI0039E3C620
MQTRVISGPEVPAAVADVLAGGPPIAVVADQASVPASWNLTSSTTGSLADTDLDADIGVLIGTSGSTGDPKGVLLSRAAMRASVEATHRRLGGAGNWVCPLPLHYVAGLMTAARAAVAGTRFSVAASDLSDLPLEPGRNYLSVVAAQLHRAFDDATIITALTRFDAVLIGGSAIPAGLLAKGKQAGINLVATYGMAETCGGCVYDGVPLDGVRVAIGADERIEIAAASVFSGYRCDPDATAAALRVDPDGVRTLRTHDRGRWSDGRLQVLGRLDDVVITGGVNVDLGRAQRAADAVFGPGAVALLGVPDERWGTLIVALTELPLSVDDCRARLAGGLEPAAVPRLLRRVAGLPRTSTGKIDRRSLRAVWAEGS